MSDEAAREMTLSEWVERLPESHLARRELAALREALKTVRGQITTMLGDGHVLHHRIVVLRNFWNDPNLDREKEFADILEKRQEMHTQLVECCKPIDAALTNPIAEAATNCRIMKNKRCEDCYSELTACGEMTCDGPRMDCPLCKAHDTVQDLRTAVAKLAAFATAVKKRRAAVVDSCNAIGSDAVSNAERAIVDAVDKMDIAEREMDGNKIAADAIREITSGKC